MLKTDYPVIINGTTITIPAQSWSVSYDTVENTNTTEDGYDDIEVVRVGKVKISASYKCMATWAGTFKNMQNTQSFKVKYYDTYASGYVEKTVRMRNFKETLVKKSERLSVTNGIYNISFDLLEF